MRNSTQTIFWNAVLFCIMLTACTSNELAPVKGEKSLEFTITNYVQQDFDEATRSVPISESTVVTHLAFGVFDESTGKMKGALQVADKGSEGYGTFTVNLPYGNYRLVFLGYGSDKTCHMDSPERIYFDEEYVPQTFLSTQSLTVDEKTSLQTNITLHRRMSAFRMQITDTIPGKANTFCFETAGGGTVLNALTGLAAEKTGRKAVISIPDSYKGQAGKSVTMYLFLTGASESMDIKVSATDTLNKVIVGRTFSAVPMKVNKLTVAKGSFFAGLAYDFSMMEIDDGWGETEYINY